MRARPPRGSSSRPPLVGPAHLAEVTATEARLRPEAYGTEERLVEDVQQDFHDLFVDVTWPACPRHPNHPLWYRDGAWWCETDGVAVARLGELAALKAPSAGA